MTRPSYLTRI